MKNVGVLMLIYREKACLLHGCGWGLILIPVTKNIGGKLCLYMNIIVNTANTNLT